MEPAPTFREQLRAALHRRSTGDLVPVRVLLVALHFGCAEVSRFGEQRGCRRRGRLATNRRCVLDDDYHVVAILFEKFSLPISKITKNTS